MNQPKNFDNEPPLFGTTPANDSRIVRPVARIAEARMPLKKRRLRTEEDILDDPDTSPPPLKRQVASCWVFSQERMVPAPMNAKKINWNEITKLPPSLGSAFYENVYGEEDIPVCSHNEVLQGPMMEAARNGGENSQESALSTGESARGSNSSKSLAAFSPLLSDDAMESKPPELKRASSMSKKAAFSDIKFSQGRTAPSNCNRAEAMSPPIESFSPHMFDDDAELQALDLHRAERPMKVIPVTPSPHLCGSITPTTAALFTPVRSNKPRSQAQDFPSSQAQGFQAHDHHQWNQSNNSLMTASYAPSPMDSSLVENPMEENASPGFAIQAKIPGFPSKHTTVDEVMEELVFPTPGPTPERPSGHHHGDMTMTAVDNTTDSGSEQSSADSNKAVMDWEKPHHEPMDSSQDQHPLFWPVNSGRKASAFAPGKPRNFADGKGQSLEGTLSSTQQK